MYRIYEMIRQVLRGGTLRLHLVLKTLHLMLKISLEELGGLWTDRARLVNLLDIHWGGQCSLLLLSCWEILVVIYIVKCF